MSESSRTEGGRHGPLIRFQTPEEARSDVPLRILGREPLPLPRRIAFDARSPFQPEDAPLPFRPERLMLASAFMDELAREGLEVDGVHQLPSGNYVLDLVPKEPEDPSDG